jgi:hypothetical protein
MRNNFTEEIENFGNLLPVDWNFDASFAPARLASYFNKLSASDSGFSAP